MLITTSDFILRARDVLQDDDGIRWPDAELKRYLLDGQVAIVDKAPWASEAIFSFNHALAVGIEQRIENYSVRIVSRVMDITVNQTGSTRGKAIRKISKDQLDAQRPSWSTEANSTTILNWIPLDQQPRDFLVYPGAAAGASVRATVALVPFDEDVVEVVDGARDALFYYSVYRAWAKDAAYAKGSADYKKLFDAELDALMGANKLGSNNVQQRSVPR